MQAVFDLLEKSADDMGNCNPLWLKEKRVPDFNVVVSGKSGPSIILLHGLFGAVSNWESTVPYLQEFSKVHAFEFPIVTAHRSEVRVKALALQTEFYLRLHHKEPVILCGNSLGGHVALRVAMSAPELVKGLILSGASGLYEHTVNSLPVRPGEKFIRDHMGRVFFNKKFITDQGVHEILGILSGRMNHLNLIHSARSAKRDFLGEYLKDIHLPTLLLWGEDDEVTTMKVAHIFDDSLPDSELKAIKDCGHAPMIEHPKWFADEVKSFLERRNLL
ncbi:MAG: alpha/beta hydrolase [Bdellovibrionales bacterium]|nr:alpha/beta hydrolase [Bdellovibrionales bacterium]